MLRCNLFLLFSKQVPKDDIFRFVTEGILLTVVSIFGLIGNSMSIIVLTRASGVVRQGGASFSKLLRGLATFDALFLFIAIISFGFPQLSRWYTRNVFLYIMPIVFGLLHTFRVGSVYVTLAVTFERFHAIICPLKHFFWKKYLLPASVCVAVIYNIPKYFEMEMQVIFFIIWLNLFYVVFFCITLYHKANLFCLKYFNYIESQHLFPLQSLYRF